MSPVITHLILISSLLIHPHPTTADQSFISVLITQNGLDFIKNLLVSKAISTITPSPLSQIDRVLDIPVIGKVHTVLKDITIYRFNLGLSQVIPRAAGVTIAASDVACDLGMKWRYSYGSSILPVSISDSGTAAIEVNGMEMVVTLGLDILEGSIKLSTIECNCHIDDIFIDLDGGASWLYQGSLGFEINGLFMENKTDTRAYANSLQPPVHCSDPSKMIGIAIDEAVFKSAFALYYNAMFMHWIVDKLPEQSLLNTAGWRFIIPQLYKKYPNDDMNLNISLSYPPVVQILLQKIEATVYADLIIDVLEADDTIPVACISLVITGTGSVQITGNNLAAHLKLDDFTMSLKWSKIGTLHMFLIQPVMWTIIETVFLPYVNARIGIGFPLPIISGFMLQNAEIVTSDSRITVCSNVTYEESFGGIRVYTS